MSVTDDTIREQVDVLQDQVSHMKMSAQQARKETSEQVTARIRQIKADMESHRSDNEEGARSADNPPSVWQSMKADAAAKVRDMQDRIDRQRGQFDAELTERQAQVAEGHATDALDYARSSVEQAELILLDAIDARARADEQAAHRH